MNRTIQAACIQAAATILVVRRDPATSMRSGSIDVDELAELVERLYTATTGEKYEKHASSAGL
jgi:hypothetical protein